MRGNSHKTFLPLSESGTAPGPRANASIPWATVLCALLALGLHAWPDGAQRLFFERDRLLAGEVWRLWTGHVVHFGAGHLLWNLAVFVPAGVWAERLAPTRLRLLLSIAPALISGALLAFDPALQRYAGLSGVASGVLAFLAFTQLRRSKSDRWFWCAVLLLLAAKIATEFFAGRAVFVRFGDLGTHSVPLAHLAGVMVATAAHFIHRCR